MDTTARPLDPPAFVVVDFTRRDVYLVRRSRHLALRLARELGGAVFELAEAEGRLQPLAA